MPPPSSRTPRWTAKRNSGLKAIWWPNMMSSTSKFRSLPPPPPLTSKHPRTTTALWPLCQPPLLPRIQSSAQKGACPLRPPFHASPFVLLESSWAHHNESPRYVVVNVVSEGYIVRSATWQSHIQRFAGSYQLQMFRLRRFLCTFSRRVIFSTAYPTSNTDRLPTFVAPHIQYGSAYSILTGASFGANRKGIDGPSFRSKHQPKLRFD